MITHEVNEDRTKKGMQERTWQLGYLYETTETLQEKIWLFFFWRDNLLKDANSPQRLETRKPLKDVGTAIMALSSQNSLSRTFS